MYKPLVNSAYIDGANLHSAMKFRDWDLDYARLFVWLQEKYAVKDAYMFMGYMPRFQSKYDHLTSCGFHLMFKEVVYGASGKPKGNCDADLVLKATRDMYEAKYEKAVIISSDGDYAGLVQFLLETNRLETLLSPSQPKRCSILLKRTGAPIAYIHEQKEDLRKQIEPAIPQKEKAPATDGTVEGSLS